LGLSTSQASPSSNPPIKASPLYGSLLTLNFQPPYKDWNSESQGLLKLEAWLSPSEEGAGLFGLSHQRSRYLFKTLESFGLFFHLKNEENLTTLSHVSL